MRIDILTVLPEMFESPFGCSILKRAQDKGLAQLVVHNLRDYSTNCARLTTIHLGARLVW